MMITILILFVLKFVVSDVVTQNVLGYEVPLREIIYRFEFKNFRDHFDVKTGIPFKSTKCPDYDKMLKGFPINIDGFTTSIPHMKLDSDNKKTFYDYIIEKLDSSLPEFLDCPQIYKFLIDKRGEPLPKPELAPNIKSLDDLKEYMKTYNIDLLCKSKLYAFSLQRAFQLINGPKPRYIKDNSSNLLVQAKRNYITTSFRASNTVGTSDSSVSGVKSVYELVKVLSSGQNFNKDELDRRAIELISEDMKQNSMLLITLNEFGLDLQNILDRLKALEITNNEHILLRTLSELPLTEYLTNEETFLNFINNSFKRFFTNSASQVYNSTDTEPTVYGSRVNDVKEIKYRCLSGLEFTNYICSCCKLVYKGVIDYSYVNQVEDCIGSLDLDMFTIPQMVDLCYHLALVKSELCRTVFKRMNELEFFNKVGLSEVILLFTKYIHFDDSNFFEKLSDRITKSGFSSLDEVEDNLELSLNDCINLLVIVGVGRRYVPLIDVVVEHLKRYELSLDDANKVLINLSKVNYNNRSFIKRLYNSLLSSLDGDSILDPCVLSNLLKSYSRFSLLHGSHLNENLFQVLLVILIKEEVLSDFKTHDLVTVFNSLSKLSNIHTTVSGSQPAQGGNSVGRLTIRYCLGIIGKELLKRDINSDTSLKLIISSSKVPYDNAKFLNSLLENINLKDINNLTQLYKLKMSVEKLSLYYPELGERIQELECNIDANIDHSGEEKSPRNINVFVPRSLLYRIPSVKKRKWTY
ncbi:uncharacterized protein TA17885 [Theileria annulata]|uniref:Uncharacterized protein n=1 Tax=Theileria annulata TaxID=5874 RepID=Q4UBK3_THEAN|nr:uncharacterized protein TA17885 [Theileria annulata]CAI75798.1 hypothetical protein TA17885 [Theileria annulata]|eukprot:XP_955274.1 hypothetical protein TA17885 [Theileria annulata]